jgi:hypothetical protein
MATADSGGGLEQQLHPFFAQHAPKASDGGGVAGPTWFVVVQAAEVLPDDVLAPALDQFLIAEVEAVLEVEQRDHQPHGQAGATGVGDAAGDQRQGWAKEVGARNGVSLAILVGEQGRHGLFDLAPGQATAQHHQAVTRIDHAVQACPKEVVGGHRTVLRRPEINCQWN